MIKRRLLFAGVLFPAKVRCQRSTRLWSAWFIHRTRFASFLSRSSRTDRPRAYGSKPHYPPCRFDALFTRWLIQRVSIKRAKTLPRAYTGVVPYLLSLHFVAESSMRIDPRERRRYILIYRATARNAWIILLFWRIELLERGYSLKLKHDFGSDSLLVCLAFVASRWRQIEEWWYIIWLS